MPKDDASRILGVGTDSPWFERIKLGTGVVGKMTNAILALLALMIAVAWSLKDPIYLISVAGLGVASFVFYVCSALWFAVKNPAVAALEGADIITYRRMEMASKVEGPIIEGTANRETDDRPLAPPSDGEDA